MRAKGPMKVSVIASKRTADTFIGPYRNHFDFIQYGTGAACRTRWAQQAAPLQIYYELYLFSLLYESKFFLNISPTQPRLMHRTQCSGQCIISFGFCLFPNSTWNSPIFK